MMPMEVGRALVRRDTTSPETSKVVHRKPHDLQNRIRFTVEAEALESAVPALPWHFVQRISLPSIPFGMRG